MCKMNRLVHIVPILFLTLLLCACGGRHGDGGKMSEMEQLKYDNALKKVEAICAQADEAVANGDDVAMNNIRDEISRLKYDFDTESMDETAQKKCQALKDRIDALKKDPESVFKGATTGATSGNKQEGQGCKGTVLSRKHLKFQTSQRFPFSLNAGDNLTLTLDSQGSIKVSLYDINRKKCLQQWEVSAPMQETIPISEKGIYMLELTPIDSEALADLTMKYTGTDKTYRKRVQENVVECRKGDFLAKETDNIIAKNVFKEPKKVGLRGNLKAMFSGKSRVLVPVTVPSGCDALLYSLRISTNEKTISSDGKFADQLTAASRIQLFGKTVYERHSITSSVINLLLGNTRPPRESDAYCNMYVLTDAKQAKKFQDETDSSGNYKYDVDQSQMGTQSCNGQLLPHGHKTIYLGFENERMRYDNYIWLEIAALTYSKKYLRPVYTAR